MGDDSRKTSDEEPQIMKKRRLGEEDYYESSVDFITAVVKPEADPSHVPSVDNISTEVKPEADSSHVPPPSTVDNLTDEVKTEASPIQIPNVPPSPEAESEKAEKKTAWSMKQVKSGDGKHKMQSKALFGTIDQMHESVSGEGACSLIAAATAQWLLSHPTRSAPGTAELDLLIAHGSNLWRQLCSDPFLLDAFPNRHFDIETVIASHLCPGLAICPIRSFVGFFAAETFEVADAEMSAERIWDRIAEEAETSEEARVYIVSWNDHFFVMKAERDKFHVIDSLGKAFFETCKTGYALRFDDWSRIKNWVGPTCEDYSDSDDDNVGFWVTDTSATGKYCCREFLKKFLAGIVVQSLEADMEIYGKLSEYTLYPKLQIDFHFAYTLPQPQIEQ